MIEDQSNATLLELTTPPVSDGRGGRTPGETTSTDIRCVVDAPTRAQRISDAKIGLEASGVVYVPLAKAGDLVVKVGGLVKYQIDGLPIATRRIIKHEIRVKAESKLSHLAIFVGE